MSKSFSFTDLCCSWSSWNHVVEALWEINEIMLIVDCEMIIDRGMIVNDFREITSEDDVASLLNVFLGEF